MCLVVEHFKRTGHLPNKVFSSFADDPKQIIEAAFKLPPAEAVKYLRDKLKNILTQDEFDNLIAEAKDKAFTVAKVAEADMIQEFLDLVIKGQENLWDLDKFKEEAQIIGQKAWSANSNGYIGNRLRTIYETNLNIAYNKSQYMAQQNLGASGIAPFIQWMPSNAMVPDALHEQFYYKIFRYDDPFLKKNYPASRWGCQCWGRSVTKKEAEERGLIPTTGVDLFKSLDNDLKNTFLEEQRNSLNLTEQWKPDTNKYINGLKSKLESVLKEKGVFN